MIGLAGYKMQWMYMYKNREVVVIASNDGRDIRIITAMTGNRERQGEWRRVAGMNLNVGKAVNGSTGLSVG